jgi:mRNA deadenylase 3'-5' endonuclease subunit Ccr4
METQCDILALQEVDPTKSFFSFLEEAGYDIQYRPKGCFQGILIAYKKKEFELLDCKIIDYDSHISPRFKRFPYATGHGALLLKVLYGSLS